MVPWPGTASRAQGELIWAPPGLLYFRAMMTVTITSAPVLNDIVTVAALKEFLRVDHADEDTYITALRQVAITYVEAMTDTRLGDVTAAHWCADNALVGLRLAQQFPGTGEAEFACNQLGRDLRGLLRTQTTPTPNFRRVDSVVMDAQGHVLATLSTVVGRY